jgi:hypothetical protein
MEDSLRKKGMTFPPSKEVLKKTAIVAETRSNSKDYHFIQLPKWLKDDKK